MKKAKLFQTKKNYEELSALILQIVSDLQIPKIQDNAFDVKSNHDPVLAAINTFQNPPSVANIKQRELTRILLLKPQMKMKSTKLLKT